MEGLDKYTKVKKTKSPNSERAEQVQKVVEMTGKPFTQIAGLTRHLKPDVMYRLYQESKGDPRLWWWHFNKTYKKNNMTKIMVEKLTKFPAFRERKNRDLFIAKWSLRDIEIDELAEDGTWKKVSLLDKQKAGKMLTMNEFGKFGIRFSSLDRDWRDTLRDNPTLRGSDYDKKEELEEIKLRELGYRN